MTGTPHTYFQNHSFHLSICFCLCMPSLLPYFQLKKYRRLPLVTDLSDTPKPRFGFPPLRGNDSIKIYRFYSVNIIIERSETVNDFYKSDKPIFTLFPVPAFLFQTLLRRFFPKPARSAYDFTFRNPNTLTKIKLPADAIHI